jgi:hypothetical protein
MCRLINCICIIVFGFLPLYSQNNIPNYSESVTVTTDRDVYIAGEWLYFNLFLINNPSSGCLNNSKYAYLVLRNTSNGHISENTIEIKGPSSFGSIYIPDTLATGIYQIVAYTNFMRNYGEAAYFTKSIVVANRFDTNFGFFDPYTDRVPSDSAKFLSDNSPLQVSVNKTSYNQREKVKIGIKISGIGSGAIVSVGVRPVSPIVLVENNTQKDSLPMQLKCRYLPESNGEIIQGRVLDENNNPVSKLAVYLSTPDSIVNLLYSITDKNGTFRFLLNSFYDNKQLVIKVKDLQKATIELDNKFALKMPFLLPPVKMEGDIKLYLARLQNMINAQKAYNQYYKTDVDNGSSPGYRPLVYVKPQSVVYPPDYTYLPDFVEISREILPFLKTRLKNNEYTAEMLDLLNSVYVKPFIFLDGVLIDNIQQIIHLDTKSIYKIESIPYPRFLGCIHMPAILSVYTTKGELKDIKWASPTVSYTNTFKLPYSTYSCNNMEGIHKHTPDFRQLLYWEPSAKITPAEEKSFEFTTSDCTGNFELEIKGITMDGKTVEYKKVINVTSNLKNR